MKILFLVQGVSTSQIIRAWPFAEVLSKKHSITIIGPKHDRLYLKPAKKIAILGYSKKNPIKAIRSVIELGKKFDVICISDPILINSVSAFILKLMGKKLVLDIGDDNVTMILDAKQTGKGLVRGIYLEFHAMISRFNHLIKFFADEIVVASSVLQKKYRGTIMPVPVDCKRFGGGNGNRIREKYQVGNGPLLVYTGVIRRTKGIEGLVEIFPAIKKRFPGAKMIVAGMIDKRYSFPVMISKKAEGTSKDIVFTGHVPFGEMPDYMAAADCLLLTNEDNAFHRAQMPIKLIHYMAAGRPIIATDVGGVKKVLGNGKFGLVIGAGDREMLLQGIMSVLGDRKLAGKMAKNARRECEEKYSEKALEGEIERTYGG